MPREDRHAACPRALIPIVRPLKPKSLRGSTRSKLLGVRRKTYQSLDLYTSELQQQAVDPVATSVRIALSKGYRSGRRRRLLMLRSLRGRVDGKVHEK